MQAQLPVPLQYSVPNAGYNTTTATSTFPKIFYSKTSSSQPERVNDIKDLITDDKGSSSMKDVVSRATVPKQNLGMVFMYPIFLFQHKYHKILF